MVSPCSPCAIVSGNVRLKAKTVFEEAHWNRGLDDGRHADRAKHWPKFRIAVDPRVECFAAPEPQKILDPVIMVRACEQKPDSPLPRRRARLVPAPELLRDRLRKCALRLRCIDPPHQCLRP